MNYVSSVSYSIILNEKVGERFKLNRGLRQGDSLNPFLFLICGEGLSSLMSLADQDGLLKG